jgi:hypothetical protein
MRSTKKILAIDGAGGAEGAGGALPRTPAPQRSLHGSVERQRARC